MLTTQTAIELLREKYDNCTDYRLAKILGVSRQTVMKWRDGIHSVDDKNAIKFADLLSIDGHYLLSCIQAERANKSSNDTAAKMWSDIASMVAQQTGQTAFMSQSNLAF